MFLELIAVVLAGVASAGLMWAVVRATSGRLPRWLIPTVGGLAMIAVTISNEYSWFSRTKAKLPEGITIAQTIESKAFYRPWTYAKPFVERFVAVDMATVRTHAEQPGLTLVDIYYFGRWSKVTKVPVLADCANDRRAALVDAITFNADGTITGARWVRTGVKDPILTQVCMR